MYFRASNSLLTKLSPDFWRSYLFLSSFNQLAEGSLTISAPCATHFSCFLFLCLLWLPVQHCHTNRLPFPHVPYIQGRRQTPTPLGYDCRWALCGPGSSSLLISLVNNLHKTLEKKKPQREICPDSYSRKCRSASARNFSLSHLFKRRLCWLIFFFFSLQCAGKNVIGTMPSVIPCNNSNAINHIHRLGFLMCLKCGYLHFGVRLFRCARLFSQALHSWKHWDISPFI